MFQERTASFSAWVEVGSDIRHEGRGEDWKVYEDSDEILAGGIRALRRDPGLHIVFAKNRAAAAL